MDKALSFALGWILILIGTGFALYDLFFDKIGLAAFALSILTAGIAIRTREKKNE